MIPRENWLLAPTRTQEQEAYRPHREICFKLLVGYLGANAAMSMVSHITIEQFAKLASSKMNIAPNTEVAQSLAWILENRTDHTELMFQSTSPRNQDPHKPVTDQSINNITVASTGMGFKHLQEIKEKAIAVAKQATATAVNFALLAILALQPTFQDQQETQAKAPISQTAQIVTDHQGNLRNATKLINNTLDADEQEAIREYIAALPPRKRPVKKPMGESFMDFFTSRS